MARPKRFDTEKIRSDFVNGFLNLRELSVKNGVSYSYISKLASSENWSLKRQQQRTKKNKDKAANKPIQIDVKNDFDSVDLANKHLEKSLCAGERIHQLLSDTTGAISSGDVRSLKTLVDAWSNWDNQMRKNHRLDENSATNFPIVNVALLSSLPDQML
jgi:hypothetical protein